MACIFYLGELSAAKILCEPDIRESLRTAINTVRENHPFEIDSWLLLPVHLHCLWKIPENDTDFSKRWVMIKRSVTKQWSDNEPFKEDKNAYGE